MQDSQWTVNVTAKFCCRHVCWTERKFWIISCFYNSGNLERKLTIFFCYHFFQLPFVSCGVAGVRDEKGAFKARILKVRHF